tara:strand:- start:80368 stop:81048 length:681 start_codon:yes stop_codon:yes gene_type:complete
LVFFCKLALFKDRQKQMKRFLQTITLLLFIAKASVLFAFEGELTIERINYRDTTYYKYFVKDNLIRIDELNTKNEIQGTLLFDLNNQTILAVNHLRKVYIDYQPNTLSRDYSMSIVRKTTESKKINGFACEKWTVSNPALDTKAVFWVTDGKYDFFLQLLLLWQKKDRLTQYYLQIPASRGYLPILAEEYYKNGKLKSKLEITQVDKKKIDDSVFEIPSDYFKYEF